MQDVQGASSRLPAPQPIRCTSAPYRTLAPCAGGCGQCVWAFATGACVACRGSAPSHTLAPAHALSPRLLDNKSQRSVPLQSAGAGHQLLLAVRLQGCLRWRPEHRVRYDLRQPRGCQEVRAQVPPHAGAPRRHHSCRGARRLVAPRWREGRALLLRLGDWSRPGSRRAAASPSPLVLRSLVWARPRPRPASSARRGRTVPRRRAPPPAPRHACNALLAQPPHAGMPGSRRLAHRAPSILSGAWSQEGQDAGRCVGSCWWIAHGDGTSTKISYVYAFMPQRIGLALYTVNQKPKRIHEKREPERQSFCLEIIVDQSDPVSGLRAGLGSYRPRKRG